MKRYVQTRANARSLDYDWLGEQPQRWWERYKSYTFFEHRTLVIEGTGQGWKLYASAIPSVRRDAVGTWHPAYRDAGGRRFRAIRQRRGSPSSRRRAAAPR